MRIKTYNLPLKHYLDYGLTSNLTLQTLISYGIPQKAAQQNDLSYGITSNKNAKSKLNFNTNMVNVKAEDISYSLFINLDTIYITYFYYSGLKFKVNYSDFVYSVTYFSYLLGDKVTGDTLILNYLNDFKLVDRECGILFYILYGKRNLFITMEGEQ